MSYNDGFICHSTHWIAHAMAQMHTSISKANACKGGSQSVGIIPQKVSLEEKGETGIAQHLLPRFHVIGILCNSGQVLNSSLKRPRRKYICHRIATLIRRSENRIGWTRRAFRVSSTKISIS